ALPPRRLALRRAVVDHVRGDQFLQGPIVPAGLILLDEPPYRRLVRPRRPRPRRCRRHGSSSFAPSWGGCGRGPPAGIGRTTSLRKRFGVTARGSGGAPSRTWPPRPGWTRRSSR